VIEKNLTIEKMAQYCSETFVVCQVYGYQKKKLNKQTKKQKQKQTPQLVSRYHDIQIFSELFRKQNSL
jgi:hypothetical protein